MRTITREAGTAASAVDYHFGNVEQLYGAAQDFALEAARHWTLARLEELAPLEGSILPLPARAGIVAGIIDDWAEAQRSLAMASCEARAAVRRGQHAGHHLQWTDLWHGFWCQFAALLGMTGTGAMLAAFHSGEGTQHLLRWNRTLDRALLAESVTTLLLFSERGEVPLARVRQHYRQLTEATHSGIAQLAVPPNALDRAAAIVLQEGGIAALTFRNVAARAGDTLGRTTWHFGSKTALLERAFEELYREAAGSPPPVGSVSREVMLGLVVDAVTSGAQPILRAYDEIILHIARSPAHVPLRGSIRAYRDPAAGWALESLLAREEPLPPSLPAVFSSICRGLDHFSLAASERGQEDGPALNRVAEQVLRQFLGC